MLKIIIPAKEHYDETNNEFFTTKEQVLHLEHSLVSLSKWESKWKIPFLSKDPKTREQTLDYVRCMTVTQNVDPYIYTILPNNELEKINQYIESPMTATTFNETFTGKNRNFEIVTAELIYYWMIALNIPFECQKWHLNRLLTLIKVCNIKNTPKKNMTRADVLKRNKMLNEQRRKAMMTNG